VDANWEPILNNIKELNNCLDAIYRSPNLGSTANNKAKNILNDVTKEIESLVQGKVAHQQPSQSKGRAGNSDDINDEGSQEKKSKKAKKRKSDEDNDDALDELQKREQRDHLQQRHGLGEDTANHSKSAWKATQNTSVEEVVDRSTVSSSDRWFAAGNQPALSGTKKSKKVKQ
jgi:hypothetical protein